MSRLAERQRTIIGTLKALGYSDRAVLLHFCLWVVSVWRWVLWAAALGILTAVGMVEMYKDFFQFPRFVYQLYPDLLLIGMGISIAFAVAGTAKGVWSVLRLHPAEAMRPKPPERGGAIFLERFGLLWRQIGFRTHIALRSLFRNHVRTLTGIVSSALATSIVVLSLMTWDSMGFLVDFQFDRVP